MRKYLIVLPFCLLTACLLSCTTDAYEKGDGKYSQLRAELVEAHATASHLIDYVITDEGERLPLKTHPEVKWANKADTLYRALLYYNKVEEGADPVSLSPVVTLVPHHIDTLKTDPIGFESAWLSTTRRYINLGISLKVGTTDDENAIQSIGLHADTLVTHGNGKRALHLRFYHDQAGVPEYYSQRTYISIPTDSLAADTVYLRINTYSGVIEKELVLSSTQ